MGLRNFKPLSTDTTGLTASDSVIPPDVPTVIRAKPATPPVPKGPIQTPVRETTALVKRGVGGLRNFVLPSASPEEGIAKSANIYSLSQLTGLSLEQVNENLEGLSRQSSLTGIPPDSPTNKEFLMGLASVGITHGLLTSPLATTLNVVNYGIASEALNALTSFLTDQEYEPFAGRGLKDFLQEDAGQTATNVADFAAFLSTALIAGGMTRGTIGFMRGHSPNKIATELVDDLLKSEPQRVQAIIEPFIRDKNVPYQVAVDRFRADLIKALQKEVPTYRLILKGLSRTARRAGQFTSQLIQDKRGFARIGKEASKKLARLEKKLNTLKPDTKAYKRAMVDYLATQESLRQALVNELNATNLNWESAKTQTKDRRKWKWTVEALTAQGIKRIKSIHYFNYVKLYYFFCNYCFTCSRLKLG